MNLKSDEYTIIFDTILIKRNVYVPFNITLKNRNITRIIFQDKLNICYDDMLNMQNFPINSFFNDFDLFDNLAGSNESIKLNIFGNDINYDLFDLDDSNDPEHLYDWHVPENLQIVRFDNFVTRIKFNNKFNHKIILPEELTHLIFGNKFNQDLTLGEKLTTLIFGIDFDKSIKLPNSLIHLIFICDGNQCEFNKSINLSNSLVHFKMSAHFNKPIELNDKLMYLYIGKYFNHPIEFPNSLIYLVFNEITCPINLPDSLIYLNCHIYDEFQINFPNIKHLIINTNFANKNIFDYLPNSLETLEIYKLLSYDKLCMNNLPNSIKKLAIRINAFFPIEHDINNLPNSLEYIALLDNNIYKINNFPTNLKVIYCRENYKYLNNPINRHLSKTKANFEIKFI